MHEPITRTSSCYFSLKAQRVRRGSIVIVAMLWLWWFPVRTRCNRGYSSGPTRSFVRELISGSRRIQGGVLIGFRCRGCWSCFGSTLACGRRVSVWFTLVRIHKRVHVGIYLVQISVLIPSFVGKFSFHKLVKCWIVIGVKGGFDGTL